MLAVERGSLMDAEVGAVVPGWVRRLRRKRMRPVLEPLPAILELGAWVPVAIYVLTER